MRGSLLQKHRDSRLPAGCLITLGEPCLSHLIRIAFGAKALSNCEASSAVDFTSSALRLSLTRDGRLMPASGTISSPRESTQATAS